MKKKILIPVIAVLLLAVLFVPIPKGALKDGGTKEYSALTYKIVDWNRLTDDTAYDQTKFYFFPNNFKSIDALWELEKDNATLPPYKGKWMEKNDETKWTKSSKPFNIIKITKIYSDCFLAKDMQSKFEIKLNGRLSEEWCVGDVVYCTYEDLYYDDTNFRAECVFLKLEESSYNGDRVTTGAKPVVYLYPENKTEVLVKLSLDGEFTCTYPEYKNGWEVTANADGTITDKNGQNYNYLYWEALLNENFDLSKGFCVKGEDTAKFLETATQKLGLTRKEANEFIVYWLPLMQDNKYNIITFQTDAYEDVAKLKITPSPDTLIRVFMVWQGVDEFVNLPEQTLTAPERHGFTAVEWGGAEIKE